MTRPPTILLAAAGALLLTTGQVPAQTRLPDFARSRFETGQAVDNRYFPLVPGARAVLRARGVDEDGERIRERSELRVLRRPGPRILGVRATTQLDRAFEDGLLVEKTFDYFAQDRRGNVWYLGEDVTNFRYDDDGNLIGRDHASAWRAGERGAEPGWIMPARQRVGRGYFQEFAALDEALDRGRTVAVLDRLRVRGVTYRNVVQVLETNPFEPRAREFKYYAPGVGVIRAEEDLNRRLRDPKVVLNRAPERGRALDRPGRRGEAAERRAEVRERRAEVRERRGEVRERRAEARGRRDGGNGRRRSSRSR